MKIDIQKIWQIKESEIAKLYKDCQPQEGGAVRIGGIDLDVKEAKSNIINLQKIGGIENLVANPYYIPHHMDPYIMITIFLLHNHVQKDMVQQYVLFLQLLQEEVQKEAVK